MSEALQLSRLRVGFGHDIHRFAVGYPLVLGGVLIEHTHGLESHTDGDAVTHALMDALLSACGLPDIGVIYPTDDPKLAGIASDHLLHDLMRTLRHSYIESILNVNLTVLAEHPRINPQREEIVRHLAAQLQLNPGQISLSAGTNEKFDAVGRGEALVAFAQVLLLLKPESVTREPLNGRPWEERAAAQAVPTSRGAADPLSGRRLERRESHHDTPVEAGLPFVQEEHEEIEHLPERVKQFEKAVNTKLPPLPKAPHPKAGATLILYTDGGSRGNPGPAATGWVLFDDQGRIVHEQGTFLGDMTNNEAEYSALEEAFAWIRKHVGTDVRLTVRMDSELIVKQLKGEYQVKAENLRPTYLMLLNQLADFHWANMEHVPRAQNARADALANRALDEVLKKK